MWAQGLTIGLLVVAGALTHSKRAEALKHVSMDVTACVSCADSDNMQMNTDHSWKDLVSRLYFYALVEFHLLFESLTNKSEKDKRQHAY